jgi:hypothetical protein
MKCPFPEWLRYCAVCVSRDRVEYQETFWHRAHQLPGINLCPHHGIFLEISTVRYRHSRNRHQFVSAETAIPAELGQGVTGNGAELQIAQEAAWILGNPNFDISSIDLRQLIVVRFTQIGLATIHWKNSHRKVT